MHLEYYKQKQEKMADIWDKFNEVKHEEEQPEVAVEETSANEEIVAEGIIPEVKDTDGQPSEPPKEQTEQVQPTEKPDEFIENFNKKLGTQYKSFEEVKGLLELPKKVTQYQQELESKGELQKRVEKYEQDLKDLKRNEEAKYFSSPRMRMAFIADQLVAKHPDKDDKLLTELVMSDTSKMSDIDVLAKERKVNYPNRNLENIKIAIMDEFGIDRTLPPEEWDSIAVERLGMRADDARANIKALTNSIEIPKVETQEEANAKLADDLARRTEAAAPIRAEYSRFDEFDIADDLKYTVPEEFKEQLGGMFDEFVLKAGNEPTKENMEILNNLKDALFFNRYKKEITAVMMKDAKTKLKAEEDAKLGNNEPPNSATAADSAGTEANPRPSGSDFFRDLEGERRTNLP